MARFRGRNQPPGVESAETMADDYTLGDIVRLIDGLAESTQASFDRLEGRIDALTAEVRTGFDRVDRRLAHIETRVEGVEGRVTALEARP